MGAFVMDLTTSVSNTASVNVQRCSARSLAVSSRQCCANSVTSSSYSNIKYSLVSQPSRPQMAARSACASAVCRLVAIGTMLVPLTRSLRCDLTAAKAESAWVLYRGSMANIFENKRASSCERSKHCFTNVRDAVSADELFTSALKVSVSVWMTGRRSRSRAPRYAASRLFAVLAYVSNICEGRGLPTWSYALCTTFCMLGIRE